MKKKDYLIPETTVFSVELQQIIAYSNTDEEGQETRRIAHFAGYF